MGNTPRWHQKVIVLLGLATGGLSGILLVLLFLARQSSTTHYNISYLLWKGGFKPYEASVALPGMLHDIKFRQSLVGISLVKFESRFPSTFYEVKALPPIAKQNQRYFISDYQQAQRADGHFAMVWAAVFEDGRLIEIYFAKT